jgi:peptide-methionine (S)-S-oxide reductase
MLTLRSLALAALAVFLAVGAAPQGELATATFAGGCFWCMQPPFEKLAGVVSVKAGYTGGSTKNPTYEEVSAGGTGHRESVEIVYDPSKISYAQLLDVFWHNIDPVDNSGQFCDHGPQYRSAIFYHGADQKTVAEQSKAAVLRQLRKPIATDVLPASQFYPAEQYHQDYDRKNPVRYNFYRFNCGRDQRLTEVWGKAPAH